MGRSSRDCRIGNLRGFSQTDGFGTLVSSNGSSLFYCSGETVKAGAADLMPIAANVPVVVRGVTVLPGDFVYADAAAAVIVPAGLVDEAFRLAARVELEDAAFLASIRAEDPDEIRENRAPKSLNRKTERSSRRLV